jgi:hypothetical protein
MTSQQTIKFLDTAGASLGAAVSSIGKKVHERAEANGV